jgi:anti-sigma-K factor RskA
VSARTVGLDVAGLPASRRGDYYEVWALRTPARLVSLGTFRVGADGRARMSMRLTVDLRRFPILDVSRERADGDPAHSTVSVLRSEPIRG